MNIQDWLTGLIALQAKGLSRVFTNITIWKYHPSVPSFFYGPILTSKYDSTDFDSSFDSTDFGQQSDSTAC